MGNEKTSTTTENIKIKCTKKLKYSEIIFRSFCLLWEYYKLIQINYLCDDWDEERKDVKNGIAAKRVIGLKGHKRILSIKSGMPELQWK